jgi:hypothetical protein
VGKEFWNEAVDFEQGWGFVTMHKELPFQESGFTYLNNSSIF